MKCTNCLAEWTPPQNVSLSKRPFCQTDILQMLNKQAETLSTEAIFFNINNDSWIEFDYTQCVL